MFLVSFIYSACPFCNYLSCLVLHVMYYLRGELTYTYIKRKHSAG